MGVKIAVTRVACNTSTGNQVITATDLGGLTPKAAYFIVTQAITDGTVAAHAVLGIGAATATDERWSMSWGAEDAVATTNSFRRATTDECVLKVLTASAGVDGEADFVSFGVNSVTINWGNAPASAFLLTVILFAGADLTANAGSFTMHATQNNTVDVTGVGFEADVLLTGGHAYTFADTTANTIFGTYGVVLNKATDEQYSIGCTSLNNQAASALEAVVSSNYGIAWVYSGAIVLAGEFGTFDSDGFSCTTRFNNASDSEAIGYLALSFGGKAQFWGGIIDTPTSTGSQSQTGPSFKPQFVMCGMTQLTSQDSIATDATAGAYGISSFISTAEYSNALADEDNQATTDTQSLSDDTAVNFPLDSGAAGHVASFTSMDSVGWTWNFSTTVGTAKKWWALAIEATGDIKQIATVGWSSVKQLGTIAEASLKQVATIDA